METTILSYPKNGEELVTKCGLATTTESSPTEFDLEEGMIEDFIEIGRSMELSSVFDFPQIIYEVKNVSRSFTHQHVRHRMAAHMQQSLRYVEVNPEINEDPFFIIPPKIVKKGKKTVKEYIETQIDSAKDYLEKINQDVPAEDARFALPIGTKSFLTTAMNVESILHYFNVRACYDSQWEIFSNAYALIAGCKLIYPNIFKKCGPHCIRGLCRGRGQGKCKSDAQDLLRDIEKKVDSKKEEFNSIEKDEKISIDLTQELGYSAPTSLEKEIGKEFDLDKMNLSRKVKINVIKN